MKRKCESYCCFRCFWRVRIGYCFFGSWRVKIGWVISWCLWLLWLTVVWGKKMVLVYWIKGWWWLKTGKISSFWINESPVLGAGSVYSQWMLVPRMAMMNLYFHGEKRLEWWDLNVGNLGLLLWLNEFWGFLYWMRAPLLMNALCWILKKS